MSSWVRQAFVNCTCPGHVEQETQVRNRNPKSMLPLLGKLSPDWDFEPHLGIIYFIIIVGDH